MSQLPAMMFLLLPVIAGMTDIDTACGVDPPFKITMKRDSDKGEIMVEKNNAAISIRSPFGISQAIIERSGNDWPDNVMLRLHLKGLEKFTVTNGKITLEAAVSCQDGKVRLWKDGKSVEPLDAKSLYWMEIRMVRKDVNPVIAIPLKDGYFELQLPKAVFENNPMSITLNWIDFYR